jgi:RNA polymerase sigma-70 factor (ECF subfamily)
MQAPSPDTPRSLLERTRDVRNTPAWERFSKIYSPLLTAWFSAAGLQPADADDLVQQTFQLLLRKLPEFHHSGRPGAFRTWLRFVVLNLLRDFRKTRPLPGASGLDEQPGPTAFDRNWDREYDLYVLNGLLEQARPDFSPRIWTAFCRTALEGHSAAEVAAELEMSVNAVLLARSRVLGRLRQDARGLID